MVASVLAYRPLPSPLHAARASVGALWLAALTLATVVLYHPIALLCLGATAMLAAWAAGVGGRVAAGLRLALALAIPTVAINVLVSREGLTVFARLGDLGPFGQGDLTVEALVYGLVIALKVGVVIVIGALGSLCVDPDELLAYCRRLSFRSALTASLALRMVPLLAADAQRLAEAQRTRPAAEGGVRARVQLLTATVGGALDRALDVAATLEVRGFASARAARRARRPLSRHDLAFACSALAILSLAVAGRLAGPLSFDAYPSLRCPVSVATLMLCVAMIVAAMLPFADRRGIGRS